jgi:hypothetical protein
VSGSVVSWFHFVVSINLSTRITRQRPQTNNVFLPNHFKHTEHHIRRLIKSAVGILSLRARVLVIIDRVGINTGFADRSQVVTTIKYNSLTDFHTTNHSTLNLLHLLFPLFFIIRFLATDLSQEVPLQITMKSSCHFCSVTLECRLDPVLQFWISTTSDHTIVFLEVRNPTSASWVRVWVWVLYYGRRSVGQSVLE